MTTKKKIELNVLIFELTDACNQNCKFCYNYWKGSDSRYSAETPSYRHIKNVLKTVFKQASVKQISFSGGEPLLQSDIRSLIFYSRLHKTNVSVLTNGTLLDDELIESFFDLGVLRLQIPILSFNPETHNALTQVEGSWNKAVEAARKLIKKNPDRFNAVLVLTKQNLNELTGTLQFYESMGVKTVLVNRFNIGGLGRKFQAELNLSHQELQKAFQEIDDCACTHDLRFFSGVCTPICILNPENYRKIAFSFCNKDISIRPITINYKGDVRFCNHSPRILGNIFEKTLPEILINKEFDDYFNVIPDYCAKCEFLSRCEGGCRAASEQVYDSFAKVDPVVEVKV